jgi:oligoribonuclease NrnB/cAMP/cGMP phosphodiesterase (DHH superfamily)
MRTVVIYHGSCLDGFTSAWLFHVMGDYENLTFWAGKHKTPPPLEHLKEDDQVYIVDFSYPREDLEKIRKKVSSIKVLDHHISAADDLKGLSYCTFDMDKCGASLTFDYLSEKKGKTIKGMEKFIQHIEDQDLHKLKMGNTKPLNAYLRHALDISGEAEQDGMFSFEEAWAKDLSKIWSSAVKDLTSKRPSCIQKGHLILSVEKVILDQLMPFTSTTAKGIPISACPRRLSSEMGNRLSKDAPFAITYQPTDTGYALSFRSREDGGADVAEIAKRYGGGGHEHASGAVVDHGKIYLAPHGHVHGTRWYSTMNGILWEIPMRRHKMLFMVRHDGSTFPDDVTEFDVEQALQDALNFAKTLREDHELVVSDEVIHKVFRDLGYPDESWRIESGLTLAKAFQETDLDKFLDFEHYAIISDFGTVRSPVYDRIKKLEKALQAEHGGNPVR